MSVPGYGYERGSYEWRGYGVWTQLWAMWLLPLAIALAWRAIARRRSIALAAVLVGATLTTHVITGYLGLLVIFAIGLVLGRPVWHHVWRAVAIDLAGLALSAWLLVPAALDARWTYNTIQPGSFWLDSYGVHKVLGWLVTGKLFDAGRFPLVTILVGAGLVACCLSGAPRQRGAGDPRPVLRQRAPLLRAPDASVPSSTSYPATTSCSFSA